VIAIDLRGRCFSKHTQGSCNKLLDIVNDIGCSRLESATAINSCSRDALIFLNANLEGFVRNRYVCPCVGLNVEAIRILGHILVTHFLCFEHRGNM